MILLPPKTRKVRTTSTKMSIRDFHEKKNRVLIIRDGGGVGDILMLRMMLDDFKRIMPEAEITVATIPAYFAIVKDHPCVHSAINSREVDENKFLLSYNVTSICVRYESKIAPKSDMHRSDIWAAHCGVKLESHNMHLKVDEDKQLYAVKMFAGLGINKRPIVAFSPLSSSPSKNLDLGQINAVIEGVRASGCEIFIANYKEVGGVDCPTASGLDLEHWMACISQSDYVISVDTGTFHAANGFNKPTVGIFGWADGKVYGKYHDKMMLVQKHRDEIEGWCGPCYNWQVCPKTSQPSKPCMSELTGHDIVEAFRELVRRYPQEYTPQPS
jgi:ADP-heptose:LPS heptosyltransferase